MSVLHYGQLEPVNIHKALCGAEASGINTTFREYEMEAGANRRLYLADTEPCQACVLKLVELGRMRPEPVVPTNQKAARIAFLERKRKVTIEDCKVKLEAEDWHGVQDCASDLRDIDNETDGLRYE